MRFAKLGRPSPALVIALIALVGATTGVSFAASQGPSAGSATSAKATKSDRGPRGKRGKRGKRGPQGAAGKNGANGTNGANGSNGTNGLDGSALGYATVTGGNTVIAAGSKNVTQANLLQVTLGYVCFRNLPFTPKVATVTLSHPVSDPVTTDGNTLLAGARVGLGADPHCPNAQVSVVTNTPSGTLTNGEFQVVFN